MILRSFHSSECYQLPVLPKKKQIYIEEFKGVTPTKLISIRRKHGGNNGNAVTRFCKAA